MAISSNGLAGLKTGVCTSTTRPTGPYEGQKIYETDTKNELTWDGSAWSKPWNMPRGIVAYTNSTNQTVTSNILVGLNTTYTFEANRYYKISCVSGWALQTTSSDFLLEIKIAGTTVGRVLDTRWAAKSAIYLNTNGFWAGTVAAGSKQVTIGLIVTAGSVTNTGTSTEPNQLIIEDMGPA